MCCLNVPMGSDRKKPFRNLFHMKRFYLALVALVVLGYLFSDFMELRMTDREFSQLEVPYDYQVKVRHHKVQGRNIRTVEVGADEKPLVVLIHGAPSSSAFWRSFLADSMLLSHVKLMAIDRPGYGYSDFGNIVTSVKEQAKLVAPIIQHSKELHEKIILLGSSYGGTLAARIGIDYPNLADGIIFQSSSLAPGQETIYQLSYPITYWPLNWIIPYTIKAANEEKLNHEQELKQLATDWDHFKAVFTVLHGAEDDLIYPSNASYVIEKVTNGQLLDFKLVPDSGHDLTWTAPELIKSSIIKMKDYLQSRHLTAK